MDFEWDPVKARANLRKHGVDFPDAVGAFEDARALTIDDSHPDEDRFLTLGRDFLARIVVIHWTWRGGRIRLISARRASPRQRQQYAAGS